MARVYATYLGEEMTVQFEGDTERSDYGVPGSPVWDELDPGSVEIRSLEILGLDVKPSSLPPDLHDAIMALHNDLEFGKD